MTDALTRLEQWQSAAKGRSVEIERPIYEAGREQGRREAGADAPDNAPTDVNT